MAKTKRVDDALFITSDNGESIHPLMNDPVAEATLLYANQMPEDINIIWDVGLGIGANVSAIIPQLLKHNSPAKFISFDISLEYIKLALDNIEDFPSLNHDALLSIVEKRFWISPCGTISWQLLLGDFLDVIKDSIPSPEFIMYDPFSRKENPKLWESSTFKLIVNNLKSPSTRLVTYATHPYIRNNLIEAGFSVRDGCAVGRRKRSTIAEYFNFN